MGAKTLARPPTGIAIRPLRRFVDFSSIIAHRHLWQTVAVHHWLEPLLEPNTTGGGGTIGALNLDPIEIRITSQYCTGL